MAGYSGTPLVRKLGVAAGASVLLDGAPPGFGLDELPDGVTVSRRLGRGPYDVILCFCPDVARLAARWPLLHERTTAVGSLWIAWPKKVRRRGASPSDLDENAVRDFALSHGRVDVKVCAIDETWSGLKHVIRKADR
ncbi:MAG TPA: hypothetical protein VFY84_20845 [Jiangellales bacterium]|nr:hypothetical protein [Jiangellales bacterium]